jgi:hypothetical protein
MPLMNAVAREAVRGAVLAQKGPAAAANLTWAPRLLAFPHPYLLSTSMLGGVLAAFIFAALMFSFVTQARAGREGGEGGGAGAGRRGGGAGAAGPGGLRVWAQLGCFQGPDRPFARRHNRPQPPHKTECDLPPPKPNQTQTKLTPNQKPNRTKT